MAWVASQAYGMGKMFVGVRGFKPRKWLHSHTQAEHPSAQDWKGVVLSDPSLSLNGDMVQETPCLGSRKGAWAACQSQAV